MTTAADLAARFRVTPQLREAVTVYLAAKVIAKATREKMDPLYAAWMSEHDIRTKDGRRILDHEKLYLASVEDCAMVWPAFDEIVKDAGFDLAPGLCPVLVAETKLHKAARGVVDAMAEFVPGVNADDLLVLGLEKYDRFVELTVGLVMTAPARLAC